MTELFVDALETSHTTSLRGFEGMNTLSRWEAEVVSNRRAETRDLIGAAAEIALVDEADGYSRSILGRVVKATFVGATRDGYAYKIHVCEDLHALTLRSRHRVFIDKTVAEIVVATLDAAGLPAKDRALRLAATYAQRPMCVQYGETDWSFLERLLADEGIAYWLEAKDGARVLVLGDGPHSHDGIEGGVVVPFADQSGLVAGRHFDAFEVTHTTSTKRVHVRDLDVRAPAVPIEGFAGAGAGETFEFPSSIFDRDGAERRAAVRLEQLTRSSIGAHGEGDCMRVEPGRILEIAGVGDEGMDARWLVASVEHAIDLGAPHMRRSSKGYRNKVVLVPADNTYRPAPPSSAPRVAGVESGVVAGPPGEEIHVDDLGRVKLRFPWDPTCPGDDTSSAWARVLQMNMSGSMMLPRVGWEMSIAYTDGDPDRPLVMGRIYNAVSVHPYPLPSHAATSSFQSMTSPGGGSTNELRMGDTAGSQEMFIHASKDQTVMVGGSASTTVGADETHDVGSALLVSVQGAQSTSVGGSQSVDVGTDHATSAKGARSVTIGDLEHNKITADRQVAAGGAYVELVGGVYALQCNQSNTAVSGAFANLIGGGHSIAGGLGVSESVAAARTELVGGAKSLTIAQALGDSVTGALSITAGAVSEKAGSDIGTAVAASGSIKVGGSASLVAGGVFVVSATVVQINVGGSIKTPGGTIGGGKLEVSGSSKLDGHVKRQGGTDVSG